MRTGANVSDGPGQECARPSEGRGIAKEFLDQTIIVTGAGYGIGPEIALAFGRQGGNVVIPGPVEGERTKCQMRDRAKAEGKSYGNLMKGQVAGIPLGRMPTEADVVVYLASKASSAVAGQAVNADGCGRIHGPRCP